MAKGIDIQINRLKLRFSNNLYTTNSCDWFGRIFRNQKGDVVKPERFVSGVDYKSVLLNDTKDLTCFFDVQPNETYSSVITANVWILFSVNLVKLYPTVTTERATEYVHEDIVKQINKIGGWKITGLVRGLPAFADYSGVKDADNMQHFYLFRIECEVKYPLNCN